MSKNDNTPTNYDVGYGKPPKHSQFKSGQSGNKKGRAKGSKNRDTVMREILEVYLPGQPDGERITVGEGVIRSIIKEALKGRFAQQKLIFDYWQPAPRHDELPDELDLGDQEILAHYLARNAPSNALKTKAAKHSKIDGLAVTELADEE